MAPLFAAARIGAGSTCLSGASTPLGRDEVIPLRAVLRVSVRTPYPLTFATSPVERALVAALAPRLQGGDELAEARAFGEVINQDWLLRVGTAAPAGRAYSAAAGWRASASRISARRRAG
ncbi:MAG: hypothetical protein ACRD1R_07900, partial [Acidobacteriota bacterium]